jgi:L-2-hydroxyglutarate oxidase LhgO
VGAAGDGRARSAAKVAATWTPVGTDVNYGEITRQLIGSLKKNNSRCKPLKSPI